MSGASETNHEAWQRDGFTVSTDPSRLDVDAVHDFLSRQAYWAVGRPRGVTERALQNSLCLGLYEEATGALAGFARVVTDRATFAWLSDVFVAPAYRGRGLAKWLVECIMAHPDLQTLRRFVLATRDAHTLYEQFGFRTVPGQDRYMERLAPDAENTHEQR